MLKACGSQFAYVRLSAGSNPDNELRYHFMEKRAFGWAGSMWEVTAIEGSMARQTNFAVTGVVLFVFGLCSPSAARADETPPRDESSYSSLVDEPSREQLFQQEVIPAAMAEVAAEAKATGEDVTNLALPPTFSFPHNALRNIILDSAGNVVKDEERKNSMFGIDVSHYTAPSLLLDALKDQQVKFIYVKATQGASFKDDNFADFWTRLAGGDSVGRDHVRRKGVPADARIPRGAYHFLSSSSAATGIAQANAFVDYVNLHGGFKPDDLPPTVDLEWDATRTVKDQWVGHDTDEIVAKVLDCLKQIEKRTNRKPVLYTARTWFSNQTIPLSRIGELSAYPIWIADYNPQDKKLEKPSDLPKTVRMLWQFTDRSLLPKLGITKSGLDASIYYGDDATFAKDFGLPAPSH
jgi:lysozyme